MCSCHGRRLGFALMAVLGLGWWIFIGPANGQTLQDFFTNRETILSVNGQIERSNSNATFEAGEPQHGGKPGGHSLWISWIAPTNGVVQFKTETSRFDTLLSAYQFTNANGSTFADLREVSRADDSEGFEHESEIEFGVLAGERYEIAVDGYYGAVGKVEFRWEFNPLPVLPAQILSSPPDRSVNVGDTVSLSVNVTNAANGQLKWVFNDTDLAVTTTNLIIPNFQSTNVGRYKLRISFNGGLRFFSVPTEIQINTDGASNTLAQAKILDSSSTPLIGGDGLSFGAKPAAAAFGGGIVVNGGAGAGLLRGYNGSQIFNTTYAVVDTNEPPHCGVAGGKSYWLYYQPPTNGTVTLDTLGSTYDTVMEVYTFNGALVGYQDLIPLDCANDSFGTNGPSRVRVPVVKSRQYIVVVAGVNGASGTAWLNYNLNATELPQPPTLTGTPQPRTVAAGSTVVLTAPVTGSLPLGFSWRKDNVLQPGQIAPALVLVNVTNTHTGNYSFTVSNDVGTASGTFALKVVVAPECLLTRLANGMQLSFATFSGQTYTIEQSTNIAGGWIPWPGSFVGNGLTNYFNVGNLGTRFYRVRVE